MEDHPLRYTLANELHARPFPVLDAPSGAVYLAIKRTEDAVSRDREQDRAHLIDLRRCGALQAEMGAAHRVRDLHVVCRQSGKASLQHPSF